MWPSAEERKIISQSVALSAGKSSSRSFLAGAVGIIDGFEVQVPRPKDRVLNDLLYSGKKGCHTLNTLIVIDFKRYIRYFVAGIPGKFNDRAVWTSSPLYLNARDFFSDGEYLLADGGFEGHGANLLYSYKMPRSELEIEFNSAFTDIRKNVECGIGDVKAWAHVLQGNMWNFDLTLFGLVVHVSCLLHNYKLRTGIRCIVSMLYANIRILGMKYTLEVDCMTMRCIICQYSRNTAVTAGHYADVHCIHTATFASGLHCTSCVESPQSPPLLQTGA